MEPVKQNFLEEGNSGVQFGKEAQTLCDCDRVCEFCLLWDCVH